MEGRRFQSPLHRGRLFNTEAKFRIIGELHGPKSGIKYPDQLNVSSAPGEAPATQSEKLERSIKAQLTSASSASTFSDDPVAAMLEAGTAHIAPRAVWTRTLESMKDDALKIMEREIAAAFK